MNRRILMLDVAREQTFRLEHLREWARLARESGYNALGLYLEHRFAYPSAPWAAGVGSLGPEHIEALVREFPDLEIVPFVNLLGHFEGFLYAQEGRDWGAERFVGLQADPFNEEFAAFAERLLDDVLAVFPSNLVHLGGDETAQLTASPRARDFAETYPGDARAAIWGRHFARLARKLVGAGRTPGLWGDMVLAHPEALGMLPPETILFDWQYFGSPAESSARLGAEGHRVVACPTIQTYNAAWCHVRESLQNVRDHAAAARDQGLEGVCVTTWEFALFGNANTIKPVVRAAGAVLTGGKPEPFDDWTTWMSDDLAALRGVFAPSQTRSGLKSRLLLTANPFLCWLRHGEDLTGPRGEAALVIAEKGIAYPPSVDHRGVAQFLKSSVEFVVLAEVAAQHYDRREIGECLAKLAACRQPFEALESVARASVINAGGSLADAERARIAREWVEKVMIRVKRYGDGRELGYRPSFETLTHPRFVPHDQGNWWLVNRWCQE